MVATSSLGVQSGFWEMERPRVMYHGGKYHLFFHCWLMHVSSEWALQHLHDKVSVKDVTDTSIYHFTSQNIDGPFEPCRQTPIVPGSGSTGLYGTDFVNDSSSDGSLAVVGWNVSTGMLMLGTALRFHWVHGNPRIIASDQLLHGELYPAPHTRVRWSLCREAKPGQLGCSKFSSRIEQLPEASGVGVVFEEPMPKYLRRFVSRFKTTSNVACFRFGISTTGPDQETIRVQCVHATSSRTS